MQRRTPTKIRSRREQFCLDEIPTKDTSPSVSRGQNVRDTTTADQRPSFRRTVSLDFKSNSTVSTRQRRHSESNNTYTQEMDEVLAAEFTTSDESVDDADGDPDEEISDDNEADAVKCETITDDTEETSICNVDNEESNPEEISSHDTFSSVLGSETSIQSLSKGIYNMWRNQQLCDITFVVNCDKERFHAHRLVLATTCDVFVDVTNGTSSVAEYHFPTVRGKTMKLALKFFYTGKIEVSPDNVDELLEISRKMRSTKLTDRCKDCLLQVDTATTVRNRSVAFKYGLNDVVSAIDTFIQDHFTSLVNNDTFLKSNFKNIYNIISSDMLTKPEELQIFHACASWINYDPDERLQYVIPLMSMVRFDNISPANIVSQVEPVKFMTNTAECKDMMYQAFRHHALFRDLLHSVSHQATRSPMTGRTAPRSTPYYRSPGSTPPNYHPADFHESEMYSDIKETNDNTDKQAGLNIHGQASNGRKKYTFKEAINLVKNAQRQKRHNQLFMDCILGSSGKRCDSVSAEHVVSSTPLQTPETVQSTTQAKRCPSGGVRIISDKLRNEIHALRKPSTSTMSTEKLGTSASRDMKPDARAHDVETLCEGRDDLDSMLENQTELSPILAGSEPLLSAPPRPPSIFAMGGINPYFKGDDPEQISISQSIHQYIPTKNAWWMVTTMPHPLHYFAVTALGDKVYVTGGFKTSENNSEQPTRDCLVYDVTLDKWEPITLLKTARARHVAVNVKNVVYVIGGIDCVEMSLKSMEYYEPEEDRWHFTQPMKDARVEPAAVAHRGKILVVGGMLDVDEKLLLNTVEVHDPNTGNWTSKSRFPLHISGGSMAEIKGAVYFVGGYVMQQKASLSVDSVFRYCDETDSWTGYQTLRVPRHNALVSVIDCRIYVIGGESSASLGHALTNVECIDIDTNDHLNGIAPLMSPAFGLAGCGFN